jgi:glucosamine 6-phosphate synthetase-like amidotransferase/phosphosugar isomerase protein
MERFNFEKAVKEVLAGKKISGKDGVLAPLIKELVEAALEVAIRAGNDVDMPRNLAKSVTVE